MLQLGEVIIYWSLLVVLEDITFAYDSDRKVLNQFSLIVDKGKTVAIRGESGRGKSTLAKILLGFYKPQSGRIL